VFVFRLKLGGQGGKNLMEAVVFGRRFSGVEAKNSGIVDDACPPSELIPRSLALIDSIVPSDGFNRDFVQSTKMSIFHELLTDTVELNSALLNSKL